MTRLQRIALSAVAIGVAGVLAACSTGGADADPASSDTAAAQDGGDAAGDGAAGDSGQVAEGSAGSAGIDPQDVQNPLASEEVPAVVEGDPDATMTVDFYGLQRDGETVVGRFAFTVNADSEEDAWLYHYLGNMAWKPFLIDSQNLTKHSVLSNTSVAYAQTNYQGAKFTPGQTFYAFAVFAAPPDGVETMSVSVSDGMTLIQDVAIQDADSQGADSQSTDSQSGESPRTETPDAGTS